MDRFGTPHCERRRATLSRPCCPAALPRGLCQNTSCRQPATAVEAALDLHLHVLSRPCRALFLHRTPFLHMAIPETDTAPVARTWQFFVHGIATLPGPRYKARTRHPAASSSGQVSTELTHVRAGNIKAIERHRTHLSSMSKQSQAIPSSPKHEDNVADL